jgi:hypothetical protein
VPPLDYHTNLRIVNRNFYSPLKLRISEPDFDLEAVTFSIQKRVLEAKIPEI